MIVAKARFSSLLQFLVSGANANITAKSENARVPHPSRFCLGGFCSS